jgi:hypothetical protein
MHYVYSFLALELANDREQEARNRRRAALAVAGAPERPSFARRALAQGLAQGLAAVSRGSAAAVRQLDDVVADDLGRALAPGK